MRRSNYTGLFFRCNALQCAAVAVCFTVSNFDNDECVALFHDQVELSQFASEIAANRF